MTFDIQRFGFEVVVYEVERDEIVANSKDEYGRTPLSWAAMNGYKDIVQLLVERYDVEVGTKDTTARHRCHMRQRLVTR
jgi:ankyrin repeat protein